MGYRDYLKKEIDKFAKALAKMAEILLKLKQENRVDESNQVIEECLATHLQLQLVELLSRNEEDFERQIVLGEKYSVEEVHFLGELLLHAGDTYEIQSDPIKSAQAYRKAIIALEYTSKKLPSFPYELLIRMSHIKKAYFDTAD